MSELGSSYSESGIILYTADNEPVRVSIMGEDDDWLRYVTNPEEGVHGYENENQRVTLFLEEP